ncbi:MAG: hypothetical protein F6K11_25370, partial [Leptolyngbya sp. SIO3F4]|nr:hypothetical protein [Leptolyngbya sp. SIO3F4]
YPTQRSSPSDPEAAQGSVALQLQHKADFLKGLDGMINGAVDAIVAVEEDILSGNALERKLAERRAQYAFSCVQDAPVSLEFEALTTLETMATTPKMFPAISETIKALAPAAKQKLDQKVLAGK